MSFSLERFLALYLAYVLPIGLLYVVSRRAPATWPAPPRIVLDRPGLDLVAAVAAAVAIFLLNVAFTAGHLLPPGQGEILGKVVFLANLAIIWSPLPLVLLWRRQGLDTCLCSLRGWPRKLAWALALSILGMAVFLAVERRVGSLSLALTALWTFDPIQAMQSLAQFLGVGFLLVRLAGVTGRAAAILVCSALYGLVKYPYYMSYYGMSFLTATGIIAFSILVGFAVVAIAFDRGDVLVMAVLHVFLDRIQHA
jgi:hypothetical protein